MNTLEEQIELIKAEAEGKQIEERNGTEWRLKIETKGHWYFIDTVVYRIAPEPAKPAIEEYPIEKINGEYGFKVDNITFALHIAPALGFVFVHEDGKEYISPITFRDKLGILWCFNDHDRTRTPVMAVKIRKVL